MRVHDEPRSGLDVLLEDAHTPIAVLLGTVVSSPVLVAALGGRQPVSSAAGLYLVAIVGSWLVVGLLAGALAATRVPVEDADADELGDGPVLERRAVSARPEREPEPAPPTR